MGLLDRWRRKKQAELAAEQIYWALLAGVRIEVPQSLTLEDPTAAAVMVLRQKHPEITFTMLQSRTIVLSRGVISKLAAVQQSWGILDAHGYFPEGRLPPEVFLAGHEAFMREKSGVDPRDVKKFAEDEWRRDTAVEAKSAEIVSAIQASSAAVEEAQEKPIGTQSSATVAEDARGASDAG